MTHSASFLFWGSSVGAALNIFTTWSISRHYRWGWLAALAVQPYWAAFGIASGQYGFALLAAIYSALYIQGYRIGEDMTDMSDLSNALGSLLDAGDKLAEEAERFTDQEELRELAATWTRLRGEAQHHAHLALGELRTTTDKVAAGLEAAGL